MRLSAGAAIFTVAAGALAQSPIGASAVESGLRSAAKTALVTNDLAFATARADGRTLILSGTAPDAASIGAAIKSASSVPGVSRVDAKGLSIIEASDEPAPPREKSAAPQAEPIIESMSAADCQARLNRTLNGRRLTYRHDSSRLSSADRALLGDLAPAIASCAKATIVIEGHTDATGSTAANLRLSERRALAVKDFLSRFNLSAALVVRAYGESRPIATNSSAEGRNANRRIDFVAEESSPESPAESD